MAAFAKMRQISFEVEDDDDSSKLNRIKEICEEAAENGRKVIIFSFYPGFITESWNAQFASRNGMVLWHAVQTAQVGF